jgi:hypothetical protein
LYSRYFIHYFYELTFNYYIDSATYIQSSAYGYGDKQIIGDTWLVKLDGAISYSTVSRGDCVPLTGHIFMQQPGKLIISLMK